MVLLPTCQYVDLVIPRGKILNYELISVCFLQSFNCAGASAPIRSRNLEHWNGRKLLARLQDVFGQCPNSLGRLQRACGACDGKLSVEAAPTRSSADGLEGRNIDWSLRPRSQPTTSPSSCPGRSFHWTLNLTRLPAAIEISILRLDPLPVHIAVPLAILLRSGAGVKAHETLD